MSSDLLKEFGSPESNPWHGVASQNFPNKASTDEDEFGDFEDPEIEENVTHSHPSSLPPSDAITYPVESQWSSLQPLTTDREYSPSHFHSSTTDVEDNPSKDDDLGPQNSVIYDADLEFTKQKKEADRTLIEQSLPGGPTNTLLHSTTSTKAFSPASLVPAINGANGSQGSQALTKARYQLPKNDSKRQVNATNATNLDRPTIDDEPWVDFEAAEAVISGSKHSKAVPPRTWKAAEASKLGPPPSNIPPPSILLPVIATIFGSLATNLKAITSHQPLDQPTILSQLRTLLSTTRAAARILAGRKLRWKRDNLLSQSMKIGPAHSGKAGGMKLAGVDKAESRREDQEAAEALQIWKQQAGSLRTTTIALNGQLPENERFKICEIAESMPIRQGKPSEGMVTAPKCCFLCGIRRDERVAKVDVDVEDSFGEWWVEHWGHVDCVAFWKNHKESLRQR